MKPTVDLTLNRKFRSKTSRPFDLRNAIFRATTNITFPWEMNVSRISFTINRSNSVILTGSKYDRDKKRRELDYENGVECERCGIKLDRKPWSKGLYSLCSYCEEDLNSDTKKSYWLEQKNHLVKLNKQNPISLDELII